MTFHPSSIDDITIGKTKYRFVEHPSAPGIPHGQTARRATVYQLQSTDKSLWAFKVFTKSFRTIKIAEGAKALAIYQYLSGLDVCKRTVITPDEYSHIVSIYPDLEYSVLMPWVPGETWQEILMERKAITPEQSFYIAKALVNVMVSMEARGLSHCDLSGSNIIISGLQKSQSPVVSLVDVEEMFGPELTKPENLPAGSLGYAHKTASGGLWGACADRFAGAILLAEILTWHNSEIRSLADNESFFAPNEMQVNSKRFDSIVRALSQSWGKNIASVFLKAWGSQLLEQAPSFDVWKKELEECMLDGEAPKADKNSTLFDASLTIPNPEQVPQFETPSELVFSAQIIPNNFDLFETHSNASATQILSKALKTLNEGKPNTNIQDYQILIAKPLHIGEKQSISMFEPKQIGDETPLQDIIENGGYVFFVKRATGLTKLEIWIQNKRIDIPDKTQLLIGRLDSAKGIFPDIDLASYITENVLKISRKQAWLTKQNDRWVIQLHDDARSPVYIDSIMQLEPGGTYELINGMRLSFGGLPNHSYLNMTVKIT